MNISNHLAVGSCIVAGWVFGLETASAHPPVFPTAAFQRRISADLIRSDTQDFFRLGRIKLEREIQAIGERRSPGDADLLIIGPRLRLQPDLSPLEMPTLDPSKPHRQ
jgi:hypothetical protein